MSLRRQSAELSSPDSSVYLRSMRGLFWGMLLWVFVSLLPGGLDHKPFTWHVL